MKFLRLLSLVFALATSARATPAEARKILGGFGLTPENAASYSFVLGLPGSEPSEPFNELVDPRPLSAEQANEVNRLILNRHSYVPDLKKACGFHPDAILEIRKSKQVVQMIICLGCSQVIVTDGKQATIADFDRGRNALLKLFKAVFPENARAKQLEYREETYTPKEVLEWVEIFLPEDPLFLKSKQSPDQMTEDDADLLVERTNAEMERQIVREKLEEAERLLPDDPLVRKLKATPLDKISEQDIASLNRVVDLKKTLIEAEMLQPENPLLARLKSLPPGQADPSDVVSLAKENTRISHVRQKQLDRARELFPDDAFVRRLWMASRDEVPHEDWKTLEDMLRKAEENP